MTLVSFLLGLGVAFKNSISIVTYAFYFKGIEVARRIRDEERGGKAKLVIIGKMNICIIILILIISTLH